MEKYREKKIKSLEILTTLLDFVKNDKYIIDTYYIENDLDTYSEEGLIRKIPDVIGKTVEIKFLKIDPIPNYTHGTPRTGIMDDWNDLDIKNIPTDFFDNDNYETECFGTHKEWGHCFSDFKNKIAMVELINDPDELFKYRYKLKPKITIDCDLDKLAISIKGAMDTGKIRITDEKPTVIERLETIVKEFNYSVTLEDNGDIIISRKKPTPPQPIIIKSGDTCVAESRGVNYLCINPEMASPKFKINHPAFSLYWKNMDKIEITDEIAKLRPICKFNYDGLCAELRKISTMHNTCSQISGLLKSGTTIKLATVKDLQE